MRTFKLLIAASFLLSASLLSNAQNQNFCGSDEAQKLVFDQHPELLQKYLEREMEYEKVDKQAAQSNYSSARSQGVVYIIPVVFHIIHQNGPENISDAKVREAISVMNKDFRKLNADTSQTIPLFKPIAADCEIEFRLAQLDPNGNCTNGIEHIYSWQTNNGGESAKLNYWNPARYLNIWVVKKMSAAHLNAAAYSYTPGNAPAGGDGVICLFDYVGTNSGNSHTLSHEVGHYLNLKHPWGSTNQPNVACGDDNVSDTPITKGSNLSCNTSLSNCAAGVIENVQNFMDYSFCSTMFTQGQKTRMRNALVSSVANRNNLWSATNLTFTGTSGPSPLCAADFISNNLNNVICENGNVSYSDVSYNGTVTSRNWTLPGGVLFGSSSLSDSVVTVQYPTSGIYDVTLDATDGTSTLSVTKQQFITVLASQAAYANANYSESFESSALPNNDWEVKSPDNGNVNWEQTAAGASSGSNCAYLQNYSADSADVDELIGPTINIQSLVNPVFTFKIAFKLKTAADNDALKIWTSVDCGKNWLLRKTISGASLATVATPSASYFIPTSTQWRQETVSIANLYNSTNARIKFQFISGGGNNFYLDDINIIGSLGIDQAQAENLNLSLYPNPSSQSSTLAFNLAQKSKIKLEVKNALGQVIEQTKLADMNAGNCEIKLNASGTYKAGIYFVNLFVNDLPITQKLVIR